MELISLLAKLVPLKRSRTSARFLGMACLATLFGWPIGIGFGISVASAQSAPSPRELIVRLDRNRNGLLEEDEVFFRIRPVVERLARDAGLDPKQPLPIDKLIAAAEQKQSGSPAPSGTAAPSGPSDPSGTPPPSGQASGTTPPSGTPTAGGSPPSGGSAPSQTPPQAPSSTASSDSQKSSGAGSSLVPGFGEPDPLPKPPGFDLQPAGSEPKPAESGENSGESVSAYVEKLFRQYDANRNGQLDKEEWRRVPWASDPKESDLNGDGALSIDEMQERIRKLWAARGSSRSGKGSSGSRSESASAPNSQVRGYAESLLRQYDANKNGVLEADEWGKMRGDYGAADVNKDGVLTTDEIAARLDQFGKGDSASSSSSAPSGSPSSSSSWKSGTGSSSKAGEKKPGRFLSPLERLPKGLPSWFLRNDADGDGQIKMAEYASSWNDSTAAEFARYDLNGDGVITPAECLAAEKAPKSK